MQRATRALIRKTIHRIKAFKGSGAILTFVFGWHTHGAVPVGFVSLYFDTIAHFVASKLWTVAGTVQSFHFTYQIAATLTVVLAIGFGVSKQISACFNCALFVPKLLRFRTFAFTSITEQPHCALAMMVDCARVVIKTLRHALR